MDVDVESIRDIEPIRIDPDHNTVKVESIGSVENIHPVAAHIKEVNHIDPFSIEALHISDVKNIEPINIDRFSVTNLPTVNLSVRPLPAVDMNVRRLPPVSIGTHQDFHIPSNYTVRARFFGIEFFRVHLNGDTMIFPKERYRREQARTPNRSFPLTATAGNPAIPSVHLEKSATAYSPAPHHHSGQSYRIGGDNYEGNAGTLHFGQPAMSYRVSETQPVETELGSSVSSGG